MCTYIYKNKYINMYTYIYTYIYIYIDKHIYINIHVCTYVYIYKMHTKYIQNTYICKGLFLFIHKLIPFVNAAKYKRTPYLHNMKRCNLFL